MKRQAYGFRDREFFKLKILGLHETKYASVDRVPPHCTEIFCLMDPIARPRCLDPDCPSYGRRVPETPRSAAAPTSPSSSAEPGATPAGHGPPDAEARHSTAATCPRRLTPCPSTCGDGRHPRWPPGRPITSRPCEDGRVSRPFQVAQDATAHTKSCILHCFDTGPSMT